MGAIVLRFFEEVKSVRTAQNLQTGIDAKVHVVRDGKTVEVSPRHPSWREPASCLSKTLLLNKILSAEWACHR